MMSQLVRRGPQDLAIGNPALTPFATKLVRTLDGIPLNSGDECMTYFNLIADPQTGSPERIELRRRAEDFLRVRGRRGRVNNTLRLEIF
jgi:hypothetical protein